MEGGEAMFSLPLLLPCHFSFNLTPTSQNTFFLSHQASPVVTHPIESYLLTINTHALQTKTLIGSTTYYKLQLNLKTRAAVQHALVFNS